MRRIVFVRHGLTDWNASGRLQGQLDIPLNEAGRRQAEILRDRLAGKAFDGIYSSPLQRAAETARIIAGDKAVLEDSRLAEIHHGEWQGRTDQEITAGWPELWKNWRSEPLGYQSPGGETPANLRDRVDSFLKSVSSQLILCISHGILIRMVRHLILGTEERNVAGPANASIHKFLFQDDDSIDYQVEVIEWPSHAD